MKVQVEQVAARGATSFAVCRFRGHAFTSVLHLHPEIEVTAILAGRGRLLNGDREGRFRAGDVLLHGPGLPHAYQSWRPGPSAALWLQFPPRVLGEWVAAAPEFAAIRDLLRRATRGLRFSPAAARRAVRLLRTMHGLAGARRHARLIELLELLAADRRARPLASAGFALPEVPLSGRARELHRWVEEHWREPVSLAAAGRRLGLHPQSVARYCRRVCGQSLIALVRGRRLAAAAGRLAATDEPVTTVAYACGFNNLANFNRQFRRAYGLAPGEYRTRLMRLPAPAARTGRGGSARRTAGGAFRVRGGTVTPG
jgi:AraC-like DNA-binding protein/mannose-6-phosphate isomerase-like protein (cupin superfamily)